VIIESRSSPDQSRQIKHLAIGRTFGAGQGVDLVTVGVERQGHRLSLKATAVGILKFLSDEGCDKLSAAG
jgi:hypothetical protein